MAVHFVFSLCIFQSVFASSIVMGSLRFADAIKSRHVMNVARLIVGSIMVSVFFTLCMCVLLLYNKSIVGHIVIWVYYVLRYKPYCPTKTYN